MGAQEGGGLLKKQAMYSGVVVRKIKLRVYANAIGFQGVRWHRSCKDEFKILYSLLNRTQRAFVDGERDSLPKNTTAQRRMKVTL